MSRVDHWRQTLVRCDALIAEAERVPVMRVKVARATPPNGKRVRVMPGLMGLLVSELGGGQYLVDVVSAKALPKLRQARLEILDMIDLVKTLGVAKRGEG